MRARELPPITGSDPDSFAHSVLCERHPAIIRQVSADHPYGPSQLASLAAFAEEVMDRIQPIRADAHDADYWLTSGKDFFGERWTDVPFLWAESYFYHRLLDCVRYHEPGPWHGIDPFKPMKDRELRGAAVDAFLDQLNALDHMSDHEAFTAIMLSALLGNRADLGFRMVGSQPDDVDFELLVDDTAAIWRYLSTERPSITVIADNAGLEILSDLLLCDFLIHRCRCGPISLHHKPHPYYVSDAIAADVLAALSRLRAATGHAQRASARLVIAMRSGAMTMCTEDFYCSPESYHTMPPVLRDELNAAGVTILKGDLNYRRLVGDVIWDPSARFAETVGYFPTPVATLRSLKSDVVVGIRPEVVSRLDSTSVQWKSDGSRGLVQARL